MRGRLVAALILVSVQGMRTMILLFYVPCEYEESLAFGLPKLFDAGFDVRDKCSCFTFLKGLYGPVLDLELVVKSF